MIEFFNKFLGPSWQKFILYVMAVAILLNRHDWRLVQTEPTPELDCAALIVFAVISAAFMVGQGIADFGKGRALIEKDKSKDS